MDEADVFPFEAAEVAMQAIKDGVARENISYNEAFTIAKNEITDARLSTQALIDNGLIKMPPQSMIDGALAWAISKI
jgi:malate dehydrogenase (oxaloacetate-decarboxylating)